MPDSSGPDVAERSRATERRGEARHEQTALRRMTDRGRAQFVYVLAGITAILAAGVLFWSGRIVYRHFLFRQPAATTAELVAMSISVIVLQVAYWCILIDSPPFRLPKNMLVANMLLFCSRISFLLAGALFSIVILVRFEEVNIRLPGLVLFPLVLFTIFCFSRWLEKIGREMEGSRDRGRPEG